VPFYWCCTRQPVFRQYISERVVDTVKSGVHGVHIDDHLGTSGALFLSGGCFCERCMLEFREELKSNPRPGVAEPATYDFPAEARRFLAEKPGRTVQQHPLWPAWRSYQLRGAAAFMKELRSLAERTAGRPVPMSANACLLWGPHLNDFQALDFFSAEIEHHAPTRKFNDDPVAAYRIADEVGRPLASTASGGDWAFIKEQNLPGLVETWIALGYASGHMLMAPNRQWCYTKEKGTHWYAGPRERFAPLYRFVRDNASLFDDYRNFADVSVAYAQPTFDRDSGKLLGLCRKLARAHLSYELLLGGDAVVQHSLDSGKLNAARKILVLDENDFSAEDKSRLGKVTPSKRAGSLEELTASTKPAVTTADAADAQSVRVFPRVKPGAAVVHVLNADYRDASDRVEPRRGLRLVVDLDKLGVGGVKSATGWSPSGKPVKIPVQGGTLAIPELQLWTVLEFRKE
jgi:hypothetical protein